MITEYTVHIRLISFTKTSTVILVNICNITWHLSTWIKIWLQKFYSTKEISLCKNYSALHCCQQWAKLISNRNKSSDSYWPVATLCKCGGTSSILLKIITKIRYISRKHFFFFGANVTIFINTWYWTLTSDFDLQIDMPFSLPCIFYLYISSISIKQLNLELPSREINVIQKFQFLMA